DKIKIEINKGFVGKCAREGEIINIKNAYKDKTGLFNKEIDKKNNYKTKQILCCPIKYPNTNKIIGVLQGINKNINHSFNKFDEKLILSISNQIAISLK